MAKTPKRSSHEKVGMMVSMMIGMTVVAADYNYEWEAGQTPDSILDGKVTFAYDGAAIRSITASPDNDGTITFTGAQMDFAADGDGAVVTNATLGGLVFQNKTSGGKLKVVASDPAAAVKYEGKEYFINGISNDEWVVVAEGVQLKDVVPYTTSQGQNDSHGNKITGWANPGNKMYVECFERNGDEEATFQFQTAAALENDAKVGEQTYLVKVVFMHLRQNGDNIEAAADNYACSVRSRSTAKLDHGFDARNFEVDNDNTGYFREDNTWDGKAYSRRSEYLRSQSRFSGYGINTIYFQRTGPAVKVCFEESADFTQFVVDKAVRLEATAGKVNPAVVVNMQEVFPLGQMAFQNGSATLTGSPVNAADALNVSFETTKLTDQYTVRGCEVAGTNEFWFVDSTWTLVAKNRKLADLKASPNRPVVWSYPDSVVANAALDADRNYTWGYISGGNVGGVANPYSDNNYKHPANLYNLKFTNDQMTQAFGQFQIQQGQHIKCGFVQFKEIDGDIYYAIAKSRRSTPLTNATFQQDYAALGDNLLGVDFDDFTNATYGGGSQSGAMTCNGSGFNVRDIHLVFNPPADNTIRYNPSGNSGNGGNYTISGTAETKMVVEAVNTAAFQANGTVTVKNGGELRVKGNWTTQSTAAITLDGGTLTLPADNAEARMGTITVGANGGTVNIAGTGGDLYIADSAALTWGLGALNFTGGALDSGAATVHVPVGGFTAVQLAQVRMNGNPVTIAADGTLQPMIAGSGTQADPYLIANAANLNALSARLNDGESFDGKYFRQTADITVTGWTGIGINAAGVQSANPFTGVYDGDGRAINVTFAAGQKYCGLFNTLGEGAEIKNLTVNVSCAAECATMANSSIGGIAGYANGATIRNITVNGAISGTHNCAGIAIKAVACTIEDCTNNADITTSHTAAGGIVTFSQDADGLVIRNCVNTGDITSTSTTHSGNRGIGGIIGWASYAITLDGCSNSGTISWANDQAHGNFIGGYSKNAACDAAILSVRGYAGPTADFLGLKLNQNVTIDFGAKVGDTDVKVSDALIAKFEGNVPTAAQLTANEANGLSVLDNYVLGIDGTSAANKPLVNKRQASAAGKLKLGLDNVSVNAASGVTPMFTLKGSTDGENFSAIGSAQASPEFEIDLPNDKVKQYRIGYEF